MPSSSAQSPGGSSGGRNSHGGGNNVNSIEPYRLRVSQRWLDLTKRKLELARVPREPPEVVGVEEEDEEGEGGGGVRGSWSNGGQVKKAELVSLLDYWLESYDHRAQEEKYNTRLPQYRTNLTLDDSASTLFPNIHFVHRKSSFPNAVPLLFVHDWGSSFVQVARVIDSLCEPLSAPTPQTSSTEQQQAFHVVCPSIPGFGFSDASEKSEFGVEGTADVMDALMKRLGYQKYMVHGSRWGFVVCRALALRHPSSCIALHTAGLQVPQPTFRYAPLTWMLYRVARLTTARFPLLSFGYVSSDFDAAESMRPPANNGHTHRFPVEGLETHTQTLTYALADSPTGLLAFMMDLIGYTGHFQLQRVSELSIQQSWGPSDIIFWTMMYWLPGPEAPLRWLRSAVKEAEEAGHLWQNYSPVPLGVSHFKMPEDRGRAAPAWASAYQDVRWVRRHVKEVNGPAWEAPEDLIMDLRAFAGQASLTQTSAFEKRR